MADLSQHRGLFAGCFDDENRHAHHAACLLLLFVLCCVARDSVKTASVCRGWDRADTIGRRSVQGNRRADRPTRVERCTIWQCNALHAVLAIDGCCHIGRYVSLTPGHANHVETSEWKHLVNDGLMFPSAVNNTTMATSGLADDWPFGRGCYISSDEMTTIYVGYEDHIMINAINKHTSELSVLLDRLHVSCTFVEGKFLSVVTWRAAPSPELSFLLSASFPLVLHLPLLMHNRPHQGFALLQITQPLFSAGMSHGAATSHPRRDALARV